MKRGAAGAGRLSGRETEEVEAINDRRDSEDVCQSAGRGNAGQPREHPVSGAWLCPDETLCVWAVEVHPDGDAAVIHLDANERR
jgi:hypothetical protein